jgi:hypothetical protein
MVPLSLAQNLAMKLRNKLETDVIHTKNRLAHIQGELCGRVRKYLNSWRTGNLLSPGASAQGNPMY